MGLGYSFKCKKCAEEYSIMLGGGMLMPIEYERIVNEIKDGVWGEEYRTILTSERLIAPDIEDELYVCNSCGKWVVEPNMNLYAPNNPNSLLHKKFGVKTVEEWGKVPFVMRWDLEQDYHLRKRWIHKCECGKRLHKATDSEMMELACPHCGTLNAVEGYVNWD